MPEWDCPSARLTAAVDRVGFPELAASFALPSNDARIITAPIATGAEASPTPDAILITLRSRRNTVPLLTAFQAL